MGQLNKTIAECQKCGAVSKIETHKIRDVFDAVCPKCGSKHLYLRRNQTCMNLGGVKNVI